MLHGDVILCTGDVEEYVRRSVLVIIYDNVNDEIKREETHTSRRQLENLCDPAAEAVHP